MIRISVAALFSILALAFAAPVFAQTAAPPAAQKPAAPAKPATAPAKPVAKPATKPVAAPAASDEQPVLLGQFGDWGAYRAKPGGKSVCFALSKPTTAVTEPAGRARDASYMFISTRPSEKVKNEVSAIVGYPQKPGADTAAAVGSETFAMYTQNDGAWIKNAAEEAKLIDAMRKGADLVLKSESTRGTKTTDTYSMKGLAQALDRVAQECR